LELTNQMIMLQRRSEIKPNIDLSVLYPVALKEFYNFYEYLVFKYSQTGVASKPKKSFSKFLSTELEVANFTMPNREERNER
jgi:hypothetical protein